MMSAYFKRCVLLSWVILTGCAISPDSQEGQALQETLWAAQQNNRSHIVQTMQASTGRLLVLAAGLSDQSKAFSGDVQGMIESIQSKQQDVLVWRMWNPPFGAKPQVPFATRETLRRAIGEMRDVARPGDRILVMLTSHGNQDVLANGAANKHYRPIRGAELREMLMPLTEWETGVVISACYSGSLIPALQHPKRWIMTAAAADRNSFGCAFHEKQTYFIQGLLSTFAGPAQGLDAWHSAISQQIRAKEDAARLTPSSPQLWVGPMVQRHRQSLATFWHFQP